MTNDQIKKKLDKLLDDTRKEYKATSANLETYQAKLDQAEREMEESINESDLEKYSAANGRKWEAQRGVKLYGTKVERLETASLLPEDEVKTLRAEITANYTVIEDKVEARLREIADELAELRTTLADSAIESDKLLHTLQFDVSRGLGLKYWNNGMIQSGQWTVRPNHSKYENLYAMLGRITSADLKKVFG